MAPVLDMPGSYPRGLLEKLVFHGIVFNMSWEDPEMDRRAFQIQPEHTVISITSAGCNPLNLLCQNPKKLIAVDSNPAQTALFELKLAGIASLDHTAFFDIFAARNPQRVNDVYRQRLRDRLSVRSRDYWDKNLWMMARGIYRFGRMGLFCRLLRWYFQRLKITERDLDALFEIQSLEEQAKWYQERLAPKLWRESSRRFVQFKPFLYMAGVHPRQFDLVDERHDMYDYVKERMDHVMTRVPIHNNYFLSVTATGRFRGNHVPPYLLEENFETLRRNHDRVQVVNGWLGPFLDTQPARSIDKFNLLDIFDWMTPEQFEGSLRSVLRAAAPGATLIYRSGSYRHDPPEAIQPYVTSHAALAKELLSTDRSATYGSFYVLTVNGNYPGNSRNGR